MQESSVLNSWKEISNYIGRGVRTVQRWEKDFGLPVRRPCGHLRGSVFATRSDIDQWLTTRAARFAAYSEPAVKERSPQLYEVHQARFDTLQKNADQLQKECESMRNRFATLNSTLARTRALRDELVSLWTPESKLVS